MTPITIQRQATGPADLAADIATILRRCAIAAVPALSVALMAAELRQRGVETREGWVLKAMRAFFDSPPPGIETRVSGRARSLRCRLEDGSWTGWTPGAAGQATRASYGAGQGYNGRPGSGEIIVDPARLYRRPAPWRDVAPSPIPRATRADHGDERC